MVSFTFVKGQTFSVETDTLVWQVDGLYDVAHDTTTTYSAKFVTNGHGNIDWIQTNDDSDFVVSSFTNNWQNFEQPGSIEYSVKLDGKKGKLVISRSSSGIEIAITILDNGQNMLPFIFKISTVTPKI